MDKELAIMEELHSNNNISQREVSEKTGISLGNVNILLKKMIKEGLIKIEQIPANRVAYMLTPKGALEKAKKTYNYITLHYSYIEEQKMSMQLFLEKVLEENKYIQIMLSDDAPSEILKLVINGFPLEKKNRIKVLNEKEFSLLDEKIILISVKEFDELEKFKIINILEYV